ncbi:MAG: MFS transporter [Oscillatoriaceae cyanobacterium Prado104]|jgi:MFS family permease|nr:MFS transporter [Oscillatoriaceae cyanobacterium Prado104]
MSSPSVSSGTQIFCFQASQKISGAARHHCLSFLPQLTLKLSLSLLKIPPALKSKNFRLYTIGQSLSLIGNWMTQIAQVWLVYQLTNSALLLGVAGFVGQACTFFLASFAGVLVDRWSLRNILLLTQVLSLFHSSLLAYLTLSDRIEFEHIIILSIIQGIIKSCDIPARQVLVPRLMDKKEDLSNAIALYSSMINAAKFIGPMVAGLLIVRIGTGFCFLLDGLSYIPMIVVVLMVKINPRTQKLSSANTHIFTNLKEGFTYAFGFPPIKSVLLLLALISFMGMSYINLMPVFIKEVLQGNAESLGFIMTASGIGAVSSGIYLTLRKTIIGLGKIMANSTAILGISLIAFALSKSFWIATILIFLVGLTSMLAIASVNTFLQIIVEDDKRGRVMSLFTMAFMGTVPFGNLLSGFLANQIGIVNTIIFGGSCCLVGSLFFCKQLPGLRKIVRPMYVQMGLISHSSLEA